MILTCSKRDADQRHPHFSSSPLACSPGRATKQIYVIAASLHAASLVWCLISNTACDRLISSTSNKKVICSREHCMSVMTSALINYMQSRWCFITWNFYLTGQHWEARDRHTAYIWHSISASSPTRWDGHNSWWPCSSSMAHLTTVCRIDGVNQSLQSSFVLDGQHLNLHNRHRQLSKSFWMTSEI